MTEPDVVERLRVDAKWLQSAKHASNEVIKAGLLMENAADEITRLRSQNATMREALVKIRDGSFLGAAGLAFLGGCMLIRLTPTETR